MKQISPGILTSFIASPSSSLILSGPVVISGSVQFLDDVVFDRAIPYATTGSNLFTGNQTISGSLSTTNGITGSLYGTASNAITASYAMNGGGGSSTLINTIGFRLYTDDTYITSGLKSYSHIAYNSNIIKTVTNANTNGYIDINVKRNGTTLGTISLSNQSSSLDTILTGWTKSLNTNDLIEFYVSQSSTYITDISIFIDIQST